MGGSSIYRLLIEFLKKNNIEVQIICFSTYAKDEIDPCFLPLLEGKKFRLIKIDAEKWKLFSNG